MAGWEKAAEKDIAQSQFFVGVAYARGEGVPKDAVEACYWLSRAGWGKENEDSPRNKVCSMLDSAKQEEGSTEVANAQAAQR